MPKYIQQITTGIVFISTPYLEKMANMRPISDSEAKKLLGSLVKNPVKADVEPVEPVKADVEPVEADVEPVEVGVEPVEVGVEPVENPEPKTFRELIEAAKTKEAVEALVLEHTGADIDRRKSLATLKEEALA